MTNFRAISEEAAIGRRLERAIAQACDGVSHNLNGQRLGRKGRETRERIVRAAIEVLGAASEDRFMLSVVARQASLRTGTLYIYFTDLSELMVAVLDPVMASAQIAYLDLLEDYWREDELGSRCQQFWDRYSDFWNSHAAILHQRNRMSDAGDERMLRCRLEAGYPLMEGICRQLGSGDGAPARENEQSMASVLATMLERTVTVQSQPSYRSFTGGQMARVTHGLGLAGAQLLALAAADCRRLRSANAAQPRLKRVMSKSTVKGMAGHEPGR